MNDPQNSQEQPPSDAGERPPEIDEGEAPAGQPDTPTPPTGTAEAVAAADALAAFRSVPDPFATARLTPVENMQHVVDMVAGGAAPPDPGATTTADVVYSKLEVPPGTEVQASNPDLGSAQRVVDTAMAGRARLPGNVFGDEDDVLDALGEKVLYQLDEATARAAFIVAVDLAGVAVLNVLVDEQADHKRLAPSQRGYPVVQVRGAKYSGYVRGAEPAQPGTWRWS